MTINLPTVHSDGSSPAVKVAIAINRLREVVQSLATRVTSEAVILTSPDGTQYRVSVANDGTLTTEPVT